MARFEVAFWAPMEAGEMSPVATTFTAGFGLGLGLGLGLGDGLGDGDGEGDGLGVGDALGLGDGDGDGHGLWGRGLHEGVAAIDGRTDGDWLTVINISNASATAEANRVSRPGMSSRLKGAGRTPSARVFLRPRRRDRPTHSGRTGQGFKRLSRPAFRG